MNSQTDEIDKKKNKSKKKDNNLLSTLIKYIITLLIVIALVYGYFGFGGFMLYACKLAQSNVLPTDVNCFPYTNVENKIDPSNINIYTTNDKPPLSEKIQFPYDADSKKYTIIDMFRNYKNAPDANFLACYFISILESFMSTNYAIFNSLFNAFNKNLSEGTIVLLGPLLMTIITPIIIVADYLYFIYLWFSNMSWFFKTNVNEDMYDKTGPPVWEDISITSTGSFILSVIITFIFVGVGIFFAMTGVPLLTTLFVMFLCMLTVLTYKSKLNNSPANVMTIIGNVYKLHKIALNVVISLFVVLLAFRNVNATFGIVALIFIGIIYYRGSPELFIPAVRDQGKLSAISSYEQANKVKCKPPPQKVRPGIIQEFKDTVKESLPTLPTLPKLELPSIPTLGLPSISSIKDFWGFGKKNKDLTKEIVKLGGRLNPNTITNE